MKVTRSGEWVECTPANTQILVYPSTPNMRGFSGSMLDAIFDDHGETYTALFPGMNGYHEGMGELKTSSVPQINVDKLEEDTFRKEPHTYIYHSLVNFIIASAECLTEVSSQLPPPPTQEALLLDQLEITRARALDVECSSTLRQEAWVKIDGLLDMLSSLKSPLFVSEPTSDL